MNFYDRSAQNSGFEIGVRTALQSILASPSFLFRLEEQPEDVVPGQLYQLNESDLAARISFFIWGSGPDDELREMANQVNSPIPMCWKPRLCGCYRIRDPELSNQFCLAVVAVTGSWKERA